MLRKHDKDDVMAVFLDTVDYFDNTVMNTQRLNCIHRHAVCTNGLNKSTTTLSCVDQL